MIALPALSVGNVEALLSAHTPPAGDGVGWCPVEPDHPAVGRLLSEVNAVNLATWRLPRQWWSVKVARYDVGAYFPPHADFDPTRGPWRDALTFAASAQLSAPEDYTGGRLVAGNTTASRELGAAVAFPGDLVHEVTPVTAGTRLALVVFAVDGLYGAPVSATGK